MACVQCKDKAELKAYWEACMHFCRDKSTNVRGVMLFGLRSMARAAEPFQLMGQIRKPIVAMLSDDSAAIREDALQTMVEGKITRLTVHITCKQISQAQLAESYADNYF